MNIQKVKNKVLREGTQRNIQWWGWIMLTLVFFFGLAGRLYDLDDLPLDFHPTRQFHSMLIARGMYYENLTDVPEWKQKLAVSQWKSEGEIEPPIMERLSAIGYRLIGSDDLRIPRLLSIFFWTFGGVGLLILMRDLVGFNGAVVGLAYYMLLPFALYASRSFQPESLMTAAIIWSWWGVTRWKKNPRWINALIAGLLTGFAIFVKLPAAFFVAPAFIAAVLSDRKLRQVIRDPQVWLMGLLAVLPALVYHINGLYISGFLQGQTSFRFFPNLLIDPAHYLHWKDFIAKTLGIELFLISVFGALLIKEKPYRLMFFSVFIGYLLYGLFFSYHIVSHTYYQVPLTPGVAIGLAAAAGVLVDNLRGNKAVSKIVLGGLLVFWMAINFWDTRMTLKHADYKDVPAFYEMLGEKVRDYTVIAITPNYNYRLSYWGWKQSIFWKSTSDINLRDLAGVEVDRKAEFAKAVRKADLFLVTDFEEFNRQVDVKTMLEEEYPVFDSGDGYIIYDVRRTTLP